ncbi:MAG: hypothetical protein ACEQSB_04010 [Undibacterium sp.]
MNVFIRLFSLVLVAAGFAGCSPMIGQPGYGGYPAYQAPVPQRHQLNVETFTPRYYTATLNPDRTWSVNMAMPIAGTAALPAGVVPAYLGHNGFWVVNGAVQPKRLVVVSNVPAAFGGYQTGVPAGLGIVPFSGMSAELASLILADIDKGENPCDASTQRRSVTAFGFITGLATFALTGDAGIGLGVGLLSSLGASNGSQWNCDLHRRFRWSLMATIEAGKPRCLETLQQRQTNGSGVQETLTRDCAAVEVKNFKRIGEMASLPLAAPAPASAPMSRVMPARLRNAEPDRPPK